MFGADAKKEATLEDTYGRAKIIDSLFGVETAHYG
jgi:hypothetical protein